MLVTGQALDDRAGPPAHYCCPVGRCGGRYSSAQSPSDFSSDRTRKLAEQRPDARLVDGEIPVLPVDRVSDIPERRGLPAKRSGLTGRDKGVLAVPEADPLVPPDRRPDQIERLIPLIAEEGDPIRLPALVGVRVSALPRNRCREDDCRRKPAEVTHQRRAPLRWKGLG